MSAHQKRRSTNHTSLIISRIQNRSKKSDKARRYVIWHNLLAVSVLHILFRILFVETAKILGFKLLYFRLNELDLQINPHSTQNK